MAAKRKNGERQENVADLADRDEEYDEKPQIERLIRVDFPCSVCKKHGCSGICKLKLVRASFVSKDYTGSNGKLRTLVADTPFVVDLEAEKRCDLCKQAPCTGLHTTVTQRPVEITKDNMFKACPPWKEDWETAQAIEATCHMTVVSVYGRKKDNETRIYVKPTQWIGPFERKLLNSLVYDSPKHKIGDWNLYELVMNPGEQNILEFDEVAHDLASCFGDREGTLAMFQKEFVTATNGRGTARDWVIFEPDDRTRLRNYPLGCQHITFDLLSTWD